MPAPSSGSSWLILLAGDLTPTPRLLGQIDGARVIAADAGIRHAATLGLVPELWIGDFDSAPQNALRSYSAIPRQQHPADKDATDGALAIDAALLMGADRIILTGAFGGRMDHAMAHLLQMTALAQKGTDIMATSGHEEAWPIVPGHKRLDLPAGATFTICGFSPLEGVTLTGAKWPLKNRDIPFGSTLGVSNIATGNALEVSVKKGTGILLAQIAQARQA